MRSRHANGDSGPLDRKRLLTLSLGALGIVFGDLGTSPLYTFSSAFSSGYGLSMTPENVLGVVSLVLWTLIIIVCIKYAVFVLRADNKGEGGILALLALLDPWRAPRSKRSHVLIALGVFGAALLYGDGMITPAISVLSAVEGLQVATPTLDRSVIILITVIVLLLLFVFQKNGTRRVGFVFGPIMLLWFFVIALLGLIAILRYPAVLVAINPAYALYFIFHHGFADIIVLGAVFLCVTGAEALYADIGHFGQTPIRFSWFFFVMPALLLNYFGQAAAILAHPGQSVAQPFYNLSPSWFLYPMVVLATAATVIASQAIISGAFSLMSQAIQFGQSPRLTIVRTSAEIEGQIYIPSLNWILAIATILIVLGFKTSNNLAAAYGVAVSSTMLITTMLLFLAMREHWRWPMWAVAPIISCFFIVDFVYFLANIFKIWDGGWLPLLVGLVGFTIMTTWATGRQNLIDRLRTITQPLDAFLDHIRELRPVRVHGTGIFMTAPNLGTPPMLQHHLEHNQVLHEQVVLLTVLTEDVPFVHPQRRLEVEKLELGFYRVLAHYGFMQIPNVPQALRRAKDYGLNIDPDTVTYYIGRETLVPTKNMPTMMAWREKLFAFMSRNAIRATDFYQIPPDRTVELGLRLRFAEIRPSRVVAPPPPPLPPSKL
ncbi:MAG: potassium transporter Kup [Gammaproteobacteria bacterium]|nr:potassium transporter Kup [Gammaproteobacteria bacterium]MDE2461558.1 potassium transporter Kup [Gammaproteobacteria bacterium]